MFHQYFGLIEQPIGVTPDPRFLYYGSKHREDLGLDISGKDLPAMHEMLNRLLTEEMHAGWRFVLVIDEAQNLEEKVLESVRLLQSGQRIRISSVKEIWGDGHPANKQGTNAAGAGVEKP